jgi:hypothetical protein
MSQLSGPITWNQADIACTDLLKPDNGHGWILRGRIGMPLESRCNDSQSNFLTW